MWSVVNVNVNENEVNFDFETPYNPDELVIVQFKSPCKFFDFYA